MSAPPREGFWQEAFAWQGSVTPLVLPNVIALGVYALGICLLVPWIEELFAFKLQMDIDPFGIAGAALSLLLVLRTNAGYDRWWEARKLWGGIVNQSRNLAIEALAYGSSQPGWQTRVVRFSAAYPFVTKAGLRGEALAPDVAEMLGEDMAARIAAAEHMPSFVSLEIAKLLEEARQSSELDSFAFLQLDRERSLLIDYMGGCERIIKTPLARVYSIKVRRFIALYLLIIPFPLMDQLEFQWMVPIITMLVAYPLFSLDEIGLELQNPFWEKNLSHLPLTAISRTIKANLLGLLAQTEAAKVDERSMADHEDHDREVPPLRVRQLTNCEVALTGDYVLYWMTAFRRTEWNFALQQAVNWSVKLKNPLVVLEALQSGYRWASDRLHHFVVQGMADNQQRFAKKSGVTYFPYLEPKQDAGKGLLAALAEQACVVVGDDYPCFFLPHMLSAAAKQMAVRFEVVDANGLLPLRAADKVFARAFDFRRFLQKNLLPHLADFPQPDPLAGIRLAKTYELPPKITRKWPLADPAELVKSEKYLTKLPIDHSVPPVATTGGAKAAQKTLRDFVARKLKVYDTERNRVQEQATSGLSPYLHFGHISAHQVFAEVTQASDWNPARVAEKATGSASDWWGTSAAVEGFLDQLATWREVGFNMCWQREDYDQFDSLPAWAIATLDKHAKDKRDHVYSLAEFEAAQTYDELWNAAQRQLVQTGTIHNYLRMLWGKKILHWSASPREALAIMLELNNKYALDGRDPNSYSGIFWCLGRYDRPWGPERPIFGQIRYMTSDSTRRKMKVDGYLEEFGPGKKLF